MKLIIKIYIKLDIKLSYSICNKTIISLAYQMNKLQLRVTTSMIL